MRGTVGHHPFLHRLRKPPPPPSLAYLNEPILETGTTNLTSKGRVLTVAGIIAAFQDQLITGQNMGLNSWLPGCLKKYLGSSLTGI